MTIDDILKLKTVREVQISPDEKWVAYTVSENDIKKDKCLKRVYMITISGDEAIAITVKAYSASQPRCSADSKYLFFLANKGKDEKTQVWASKRNYQMNKLWSGPSKPTV